MLVVEYQPLVYTIGQISFMPTRKQYTRQTLLPALLLVFYGGSKVCGKIKRFYCLFLQKKSRYDLQSLEDIVAIVTGATTIPLEPIDNISSAL